MDEPQFKCKFKQPKSKWIGLPKGKSLFTTQRGFGIPIGNLDSQIFANYMLDDFDKFVINDLGFMYYGRYVDDFYILDKSKERLLSSIQPMKSKLQEIGITLHPKKIYLQKINNGIQFVGSVIKPHRTYISNRTKGNIYSMIHRSYKYIKTNTPTLQDLYYFIGSINSYFGYLKHHNTYNIRKKILHSKEIEPWYKYCYIDKSYLKLVLYKEYKLNNAGIFKQDIINKPHKYKIQTDKLPLTVL